MTSALSQSSQIALSHVPKRHCCNHLHNLQYPSAHDRTTKAKRTFIPFIVNGMTRISLPSCSLLGSRRSKLYSVLCLCALSLGYNNKIYDAHRVVAALNVLDGSQDTPMIWYCRGVLYAMEGLEHEALSSFQQGLKSCRSNSVDHRLISTALSNIQKQQRVDFVSVMPNELVCRIFLMVKDEDPIQLVHCMKVSKLWCHRLSQCCDLWQEIKFQGRVCVDQQARLLPLIAAHQTSIVISRLSEQEVTTFTYWMLKSKLKRLSGLCIRGKIEMIQG